MATVRTVDFLPEIFQTSTNKQFLAATLDQLAVGVVVAFFGLGLVPAVAPAQSLVAGWIGFASVGQRGLVCRFDFGPTCQPICRRAGVVIGR